MPMINIEDAYILDETGAQVDQVTGLYFKNENASDTEKAQARANIGAGGSNRNLLDNAYFAGGGSQLGDGVLPINQRGQTSYTGGYGIDRWRCWQASTVTLTAAGLTFATGANADGLFQYFPQGKIESLYGEMVTVSLLLTDGTLHTATGVIENSSSLVTKDIDGGYFGYTAGFFRINIDANRSMSIKAVKLEKGTISTLANDVPPDFGEELLKCQRYFVRLKADIIYQSFGLGITDSADGTSASYTVPIPLPTSLRAATTNVTFSNIAGFDGTAFRTISKILLIRISGTVPVATIVFSLLGSFTNGQPVLLLANQAGAYIDISAEL